MFRKPSGLIILLYLIVGVFVAWNRSYLTPALLRAFFSAILGILLWFLLLLGANLHVHG